MRKTKRLISSILLIVLLVQHIYTPVLGTRALIDEKNKFSELKLLAQRYEDKFILSQEDNVFKDAVFSGDTRGKLEFEASKVNIEGDVHSNYGISDETSQLNVIGKLQAVGKIDLQKRAQVKEVVKNANVIEIPDLYEEILESNLDIANVFNINTSFNNYSNIDFNDPIIVHGKATFNNSKMDGKGNILAKEDIIIESREVNIDNDYKVFYYSENGDIIVKSDNTSLNGVLYAPNGKIVFEGKEVNIKYDQYETEKEEPNIESPQIEIILPKVEASIGEKVQATIIVTDNKEVENVLVYLNNKLVMENQGSLEILENEEKVVEIKVVATDTSGNESIKTSEVKFIDTTDKIPPIVKITSPIQESKITEPTPVIGTVEDETELLKYTLEYRLEGTEEHIILNESNEVRNEEELGTFDPTTLESGIYIIRLTAQDKSGNISSIEKSYLSR